MKPISQLYRYCNYLSLDVACGAMICAAFFARILHVELRPYGLASLGLTVWIIYTADHLLDAYRLKHEASSSRHRFHQKNLRTLLGVMFAAIVVDLLLILFVRKPILNWGMQLSLVVLLYLFFQHKLVTFKELVISLLYSAGILLPAMSLTTVTLSMDEIVLIAFFMLTVFTNLVLFSWYDLKHDLADNQSSIVTVLGKYRVEKIFAILFLTDAILFVALILVSSYQVEALILAAMNLTLLLLFLFPQRFSGKDLYRIIGDVVFLFPFPYLLWIGR